MSGYAKLTAFPVGEGRGQTCVRKFTAAQRLALFRYLGNPEKLKTNPLAARFFFGGESVIENQVDADAKGALEVRNAIVMIAKRLRGIDLQQGRERQAERHFQAIFRCDVGREPQKVVAFDLGISIRHLRRERVAAQKRIAEILWLEGEKSASVSLDLALLELALSRQLWEAGDSNAASGLLTAIASTASSLRYRIRAIVDLADVLIQQGQVDATRRIVGEAASAIASSPTGAVEREICVSWIELAQSRIEFATGNHRAAQALENAAILTMTANGARRDIVECEMFARGLVARARRRNIWGEFEASRQDLDQVRELYSGPIAFSAALTVEYLTTIGDVALSVTGYDPTGYAALKRALVLAQEHGLGRRAVIAGRTLADMQYLLGERAAAEDLNHACVEAAVALGMSDMIMEVALDAAELALVRRDWQRARPYVELAKQHVATTGTSPIRLRVADADCLLLSGRADLALRQAQSANASAAAIGNERLRGTALRTLAEAQFALKKCIVEETVREMLSILERHGSKGSLALGLALAARISGNPHTSQSISDGFAKKRTLSRDEQAG